MELNDRFTTKTVHGFGENCKYFWSSSKKTLDSPTDEHQRRLKEPPSPVGSPNPAFIVKNDQRLHTSCTDVCMCVCACVCVGVCEIVCWERDWESREVRGKGEWADRVVTICEIQNW